MNNFEIKDKNIDTSNQERIFYFKNMSEIMRYYDSTSEEVNELVNWMYSLTNGFEYKDRIFETNKEKVEYEDDIKDNIIKREVNKNDYNLFVLVSSVYEYSNWKKYDDVLHEILKRLYFLLDKIVHPYSKEELDIKDEKMYIEFEFEES